MYSVALPLVQDVCELTRHSPCFRDPRAECSCFGAAVGSKAQCLTSDDTQMNVTNAQAIYVSGSHDFAVSLFQKLYTKALAEVNSGEE